MSEYLATLDLRSEDFFLYLRRQAPRRRSRRRRGCPAPAARACRARAGAGRALRARTHSARRSWCTGPARPCRGHTCMSCSTASDTAALCRPPCGAGMDTYYKKTRLKQCLLKDCWQMGKYRLKYLNRQLSKNIPAKNVPVNLLLMTYIVCLQNVKYPTTIPNLIETTN